MARIRLFVDYENVQTEGLRGISKLAPCCTTNIIYSKKAERIRVSEVMELMSAGSEIRFFEAENGTPNALDFQLLTLMLIDHAKYSGDVFVVISRDSGYDCAIRAARSVGVRKIVRCSKIEELLPMMPSIIEKMQVSWKDSAADEITAEKNWTKEQLTATDDDWSLDALSFGEAQPDSDGYCDTPAAENRRDIGEPEDTCGTRDGGTGTP